VAAGLRDAGFDGSITLVGDEAAAPYDRPHLSKGYLLGTVPRERLWLRPAEQYAELQVDLVLGDAVADLGLERRAVALASGRTVAWDHLCVATGSSARALAGFEGALRLRSLEDADVLRAVIGRGAQLDIVGAGFIGCEVAAAAAQRGFRVVVHEAQAQPLARVVGAELGAYLAGVHRAHGVDLRLLASAPPEPAGDVLVAVGSAPRTELAARAGLSVDGGIVVDERGRTSAPEVFAAGDVTRFFSPWAGRPIRVEHFQSAQRQGFAVGRAMAGAADSYDEVPWFWSDQYDLNLQYAGAALPWDRIAVRGDLGRPPFAVFYLQADRLVAVAGVNDHHTVARARRLMAEGVAVSPQALADPGFDLRRALP
jgi:3-phenylpropionate/trans-cinnamate dioxygenase ferredoxin reductase subunit